MQRVSFTDCFEDISRDVTKIPTDEYLSQGMYPIVDQGSDYVGGYTNSSNGLFTDVPVVVFGDHTRRFKYVNFPFFAGADGVKILAAKDGTDAQFGYYALLNQPLRSLGYSRHYKLLKGKTLPKKPLSVQRRIAGVLGAMDEKIAVNRRKIAELEALVKTVYDYWFVQFDFPDAHGRPYRSSGGKMTWNASLKREVPDGWEVVPLSESATITMGQSPEGSSFNETGEGTPFFQGSTDFGTVAPENRVFTTAPSRMAQAGDLLLSVRAPVGATNLALTSCCIGRGLASLRGRNCSTAFIRRVLENVSRFFAAKNVDGTTFGSLSKDELRNIKVLKPSDACLRAFDGLADAAEKQLLHLAQQIRELTLQRDVLLPLLMNGQVEVA